MVRRGIRGGGADETDARGLTTGNLYLIPTSAARRRWFGSRTVLGGKGSHSRAKPGRALASPAPFCRFADRDGRLRRESDTTRVRVVEDEEHEENRQSER
jgi:hypothetical protein